MYKCLFCGHELIWNADFDSEEIYGEDCDEELKGRVYSTYTCPNCGAEIEALQPRSIPPKRLQS